VAALSYALGRVFLREYPALSVSLRLGIALFPLIPALFYVRAWGKFLRQLDELQRRLQLEIWLFAALGTIFINVVNAILSENGLGWPLFSENYLVGGSYFVIFILWFISSYFSNRRYS